MSTTKLAIDRVLNRLRGALGTGETPPNSNHNFITEWYNKTVAKIGDGPWCEMTNTWAAWTGGAQSLKAGRAYTVYAVRDALAGTRGSSWHWGTKGMKAGDQVYYDWSGRKMNADLVDHTGTVEQILGDGTFHVLEGNTTGNKLLRMRRDGKYVVGYVRLDWEALGPIAPTPAPKPPAKPKPNPVTTKRLQSLLEVASDGKWGAVTDSRAQLMRTAARAKVGWPKRVNKPFRIVEVQRIVDTKEDGVWGNRSQASLSGWVELFQHALGVPADGDWGPRTDNAFLAARKRNLNNF
jgi:hypothetical protein